MESGRGEEEQEGQGPHTPLLSSGVVPDVILNFIPKILLETERKKVQMMRIKENRQHWLQERKLAGKKQ